METTQIPKSSEDGIPDVVLSLLGAGEPCCFTVEELKEEIELSEDDDRHNRYYTTEELRKKHPLCNK